jgi:hypothetical protein
VETAFGPIAGTNGTVNTPTVCARCGVGTPPSGNENAGLRLSIDNNTPKLSGNVESKRNNKPPAGTPAVKKTRRLLSKNAARGHAARIFTEIFAIGLAATSPAELPSVPRRNIAATRAAGPSAVCWIVNASGSGATLRPVATGAGWRTLNAPGSLPPGRRPMTANRVSQRAVRLVPTVASPHAVGGYSPFSKSPLSCPAGNVTANDIQGDRT